MTATYPFEFRPSIGWSPEKAPTPVEPTERSQPVVRAMLAAKPGLNRCYNKAKRRDPGTRGWFEVSLAVDDAGTVTRSQVLETTVADRAMWGCIEERLRGLRVPGYAGNEQTTFKVVMSFGVPHPVSAAGVPGLVIGDPVEPGDEALERPTLGDEEEEFVDFGE